MIKKILISTIFLLSLSSFAQEGSASPYSFYGIGNIKYQGTAENKAMAGLGILPDSIHINLQNPASLSALQYTTFGISGTYNTLLLKNSTSTEKARRSILDYLVAAFPIGKLGLSFGLMPYSTVGYKINDNSKTSVFKGNGGVNKVFVGAGYQINKKLSVGADFNYQFGQTETSVVVFQNPDLGVQYATREKDIATLDGAMLNFGAIYKTKFKKYDFVTSFTLSPSSTLQSENFRNLATIQYGADGSERVFESKDIAIANSKVKLPSKIAFGSGIGTFTKWFVGFETSFQGATDYGKTYASNVSFESVSKLSIGGYFTPNFNSFSNYFKKITYRAGFRHENTGLVINNQSINDTALTLGLGLPVGGTRSNINLGIEYGKKGTTKSNLIQENYLNFTIGLSFNDKWFVKRKFD